MGEKVKKSKTVPSSVCRVHKSKNFTLLSNSFLRSSNLSLASVGLMGRVMGLPEEWDYSVKGLCSICKEGKTAVDSALKELKNAGYLTVTKLYADMTASKGIEYVYDFFEMPISKDEADKHRENVKAEAKAAVSGAELSTEMLKTAEFSAPQEGEKQGAENLCLDALPLEVLPIENRRQYNTKKENKQNKILSNKKSIYQSTASSTKAKHFVEKPVEGVTDRYITDKEKIRKIIKENIEYDDYAEWIEFFGNDYITVKILDQMIEKMIKTAVSGKGRKINDDIYSAQEVQDSLLKVNRACLERGYEIMHESTEIRNPMNYLMSVLIDLANGINFIENYEERSIEYDVGRNVLCDDS